MNSMHFRLVLVSLTAALCLLSCKQETASVDSIHYQVYSDYNGQEVPKDFSALGEPDNEGYTNDFMLLGIPGAAVDHFAARLEGPLELPESGVYKLFFISDDGGLLFVDDKLVIDHDGKHGISVKTDSVYFDKGVHNVRIDYFNNDKALKIELLYSINDGPLCRAFSLGDTTPDFVEPQVMEAYERYAAWKGEDETVVFPVLTDVHTSGRETYKHIGYIAETADIFAYDFMVNLGDIGLNDPLSSTMEWYADGVIESTRKEMAGYDGVFLYAAGNHDWDAGEGGHNTSAQLSEWFQEPSLEKAGGNLHVVPGTCYGWYDVPEKNVRMIFLNSQGSETVGVYYVYDDEQLEWLRALLNATPDETSIVLLSHLCPHLGGKWTTGSMDYNQGSELLMSLLSDAKASGKKILAMICGDSHVNALLEKDGVKYFISQGYGGDMGSNSMQQDIQKRALFNYTKTLCVDVIAIKPETGEVRSFRIGAGGADMDYVIAE